MTIKAYFDCAWKGPKIKVDSKGNATVESHEAVGEWAHDQKSPARRPAFRLRLQRPLLRDYRR